MSVKKTQSCIICHKRFSPIEGLFLRDLNDSLKQEIIDKNDFAKSSSFVCLRDLQIIRLSKMQHIIDKDLEMDQKMNDEFQKELSKNTYVIRNLNDTIHGELTRGQKLSDAVARFGGSWGFIISFIVILIVWMAFNVVHFLGINFDPYPFILLNLFLSCIAAIQAPIIMMSQNRQAQRDRFDAENDYRTNTKSEMEIRILHEKIDQLNEVQWPHLLDIQKMQVEVLSELENEIQSNRAEQERSNNPQHRRHRNRNQ
ncbi:hypothetical protein BTM29_02850 [Companilactobacillus allii]|uniref:Cyclic nucleotide-binding protein n=2 Tax=Companilactobacillus allii TaxID=1847728 RepID=A0A1P8Q123_9LACO|nr:DUF1003 domain-containing protein [Companilactobacillus allii]APX71560.1 hypothetical protein BTM29_02850 [Companilactobacillus allii]